MKKFILSLSLVCSLLVSAPSLTLAEPAVSKSQAASIASSRYPGKIINVTLAGNESSPVYRVKILDDKGGMHIIIVDGNNGKILSAH